MKRILFAAVMATSVNLAHAGNIEDIGDAAAVTAGQATNKTIGGSLGFLYHAAVTSTPVNHPAAAAVLDSEINDIVTAANKTWFNKTGLGQMGGTLVTVEYDVAQVARYAGLKNVEKILASTALSKASPSEVLAAALTKKVAESSSQEAAELAARIAEVQTVTANAVNVDLAERAAPSFGKTVLNMRLTNLSAELNLLKDAGAVVRKVTIKGLVPRVGGYGVALFQVYFFGVAASDAFAAANLAWQANNPDSATAWEANNCKVVALADGKSETACEQAPNWLQEMINNSVLTVILPD